MSEQPEVMGKEFVQMLHAVEDEQFSIEVGLGVETAALELFRWRNVPDDLAEAYEMAFTKTGSVFEHYSEICERGEKAVTGFVSSLKGKLFELRITEKLESQFDGFQFSISPNPTQPVWDLVGVSRETGEEIFVQAKIGGVRYATQIVDKMEASPDVVFSVGTELLGKIRNSHPHLQGQLHDSGISNLEFTKDVENNLEVLADNYGIEVPDELGEMLPFVGNIVLGTKLIYDIVSTEKELADVAIEERSKVHVVRVLLLMTRFGVSGFCTWLGAAAGTAVAPGPGSIVGALSGVGGSMLINRRLKGRVMELALRVCSLDESDMFYLQNKKAVDALGSSMSATAVKPT